MQALPLSASVCFATLLAAPLCGQNLLQNPGFEAGSQSPDAWTTWSPSGSGLFIWSDVDPHDGSRCVEVTTTSPQPAMWRQVVGVTGGELYTLSGWIETDAIAIGGESMLQAVFRDAAGSILEFVDLSGHAGTITPWMFDFPHLVRVRAPQTAVLVEVNLYLSGPGSARFDDIHFGPCESGTIGGSVCDNIGPLAGVEIELWGADLTVFSDHDGHFSIPDVPDAAPRWALITRKDGYRDTTLGGIDVREGELSEVSIVMRPGSNPQDTDLRIKAGRLYHKTDSSVQVVDPEALIDRDLYPDQVLPFLESSEFIDSDATGVQAVAQEILRSVDPELRTNLLAVSHAAYVWIIRNIEYDVVYATDNYTDPTSGAWQTISGEGWCWGHNFTDWLYKPSEALQEKRGICIEHGRLGAAILRALDIPARPKIGHSTMFWVQPPAGEGYWTGMSTSGGRAAYRDRGDEWAGYGILRPNTLFLAALDSGPVIHSDWFTDCPGLWREVHPFSASYPDTPAGYAEALADLATFSVTGEAPPGHHLPPGPAYVIAYSDVTIDLRNIRRQRDMTARFPCAMSSDVVTDLGEHAWWSDKPACIGSASIATETNGHESIHWLELEVDLRPLLGPLEPIVPKRR